MPARGPAQVQTLIVEKPLKPLGYKQITGLTAVKGLDDGGAIPAGATYAYLTCTGQNVRWRDDGTNPTASVSMLLKTTDPVLVYKGSLAAIKFIQASATAVLDVTFYGEEPAA